MPLCSADALRCVYDHVALLLRPTQDNLILAAVVAACTLFILIYW